jgi:hypothetical protein
MKGVEAEGGTDPGNGNRKYFLFSPEGSANGELMLENSI